MSSDEVPDTIQMSTVTNDLSDIRAEYFKIMKAINLLKGEEIVCFTEGQITASLVDVPISQLANYLSAILFSLQTLYLTGYFTEDNCSPEEHRNKEKIMKTETLEEDTKPELVYSPISFKCDESPVSECVTSDILEECNEECATISEEDTRPELVYSPTCFRCDVSPVFANNEKISCVTSNIHEECNEECDHTISDTSEEQTNTKTQPLLARDVKECQSDLIQCNKCKFTSTLPSAILLHEAIHKRKRGELLFCSMCDYQTKRSSHFNDHIVVHTGDRQLKCYHCDTVVATTGAMAYHMSKQHPHAILKCGECDFSVFSSAAMKRHVERHNVEQLHSGCKLLTCGDCTYTAITSLSIKLHQTIHTKKRGAPYKCTECSYVTEVSTNFNNHISVHTGERPYACEREHCNMAFATAFNLARHVRQMHSCEGGGKPSGKKKKSR